MFIRYKVLSSPRGILLSDSEVLEKTWTLIPIFILVTIAYPSIHLLCIQDSRSQHPLRTIKMVRNQWNWQRESVDLIDHLLDSDSLDLISGYESPVLLRRNKDTRLITVSTDVLHSLGIPRLGVKLDASPGRIRATLIEVSNPGVYLGSCYELCGRGHRAIPVNFFCI